MDIRNQITDAAKTTVQTVDAANAWNDPDLTPNALGRRRTEKISDAINQGRSTAAALMEQAQRNVTAAENAARRPGIDEKDMAGHVFAQSRWSHIEKMMDNGRSLGEIIAQSEPGDLEAIYEHGPQFIQEQAAKHGLNAEQEAQHKQNLLDACDARAASRNIGHGLKELVKAREDVEYVGTFTAWFDDAAGQPSKVSDLVLQGKTQEAEYRAQQAGTVNTTATGLADDQARERHMNSLVSQIRARRA